MVPERWDYERMAMSGVVAVCEPAFWAGLTSHQETFSFLCSNL